MGEHSFAALGVINGAAGEISADGDANHARRGKSIVGAPANQREFAAKLHHGGPDVIEELYFDDRLQSALGHAGGSAHDVGFRDRRVENAIGSEVALQTRCQLEYSALAFDQFLL